MTLRVAISGSVLAAALALLAQAAGHGSASGFLVVGIDANVSGNTPRSVAQVDDCSSVGAGETIEIDIMVPDEGIPADRGLVAYQFNLFYDPEVVWVVGDDNGQLLDQAPGSALVPLADQKPDRDGVYLSSAVDFGPSGIEPAGSSEKGPGVLARVTLEARKAGHTGLVLQNLFLKDDETEDIEIDSVQPAHIYVGEPCPGFAATLSPTATPGPTATPSGPTPSPAPSATGGAGGGNPAPGNPAEPIVAGGAPARTGPGAGAAVSLSGLALAALGAATLTAGLRSRKGA